MYYIVFDFVTHYYVKNRAMPITTPICVGVARGVTKNPPPPLCIQIPGSSPEKCYFGVSLKNYMPSFGISGHIIIVHPSFIT